MTSTAWPAQPTTEAGAGGYGLLHGERLRAYQAALRHSRMVRTLRLLLPAAAVLAMAGVTAWTLLKPAEILPGVEMGPVALNSTRVTMERPRLSGFRKDGKPYEVTSLAASQDVRKPGVLELDHIKARLGAPGDNAVLLTAAAGLYDMKTEQLQLTGGVRVSTENGDTSELEAASINLKAGEMTSSDPVRITTAAGDTVDAESMRVLDNGKVILFEGRVRTVLNPPDDARKDVRPASSGPATPAASRPAQTDTGHQQ